MGIVLSFMMGCGTQVKVQPFKGSNIYNFGKVSENIFRGTQPSRDDYSGLKKLGIKTILSLRSSETNLSKRLATEAGLIYKNVPMSATRTPKKESILAALKILRDPELWPIFVHCEGGRHRTGVVIAVLRVLDFGWDKDKAWAEAKKYDFYRELGHGAIEDWFYLTFKSEEYK